MLFYKLPEYKLGHKIKCPLCNLGLKKSVLVPVEIDKKAGWINLSLETYNKIKEHNCTNKD